MKKGNTCIWLLLISVMIWLAILGAFGLIAHAAEPSAAYECCGPVAVDKPHMCGYEHIAGFDERLIDQLPDKPTEEDAPLISLGIFTITAYCPCERCCGKSPDNPLYGITATGTVATEGRTIAVDPSVIPYGTVLYIDGQAYIAEDCGGGIKGQQIDMFFDSHEAAREWGVQQREVWVYGDQLTFHELCFLGTLVRERIDQQIVTIQKQTLCEADCRDAGLAEMAARYQRRIAKNQRQIYELDEIVDKLEEMSKQALLEEVFRGETTDDISS